MQSLWAHGLKRSNGAGANKPYERTDFDFLGFDGPENELYLVPMDVIHTSRKNRLTIPQNVTGMHLRYSDYLIYAPN